MTAICFLRFCMCVRVCRASWERTIHTHAHITYRIMYVGSVCGCATLETNSGSAIMSTKKCVQRPCELYAYFGELYVWMLLLTGWPEKRQLVKTDTLFTLLHHVVTLLLCTRCERSRSLTQFTRTHITLKIATVSGTYPKKKPSCCCRCRCRVVSICSRPWRVHPRVLRSLDWCVASVAAGARPTECP